jgi:hypothetical protein
MANVRQLVLASSAAIAVPMLAVACVAPPPRIPAIPPAGLAVRLHVFGASAKDARGVFEAVKEMNPSFSVVPSAGDGEILVGLDQTTTTCVEPTAVCEFRVSYRIKDASGAVIHSATEDIVASANSCSRICDEALIATVTKVVGEAATYLKGNPPPAPPTAIEPVAAAEVDADAGTTAAADAGSDAAPPSKIAAASKDKDKDKDKVVEPPPPPPAPAPPAPVMCGVGAGNKLPADDAELRIGQVEALNRIGVLEEAEFDCLKTAYLTRL